MIARGFDEVGQLIFFQRLIQRVERPHAEQCQPAVGGDSAFAWLAGQAFDDGTIAFARTHDPPQPDLGGVLQHPDAATFSAYRFDYLGACQLVDDLY